MRNPLVLRDSETARETCFGGGPGLKEVSQSEVPLGSSEMLGTVPCSFGLGCSEPRKGIKMNIRKTLLSTIGAVAIVGGMFGGVVAADDSADVQVNFGCESQPGAVYVDVEGPIEVDNDNLLNNGSLADGVVITLDLTCNWSSNFSVSASIGDFSYTGAPIYNPGLLDSFGGEHFRMDNGSITDYDYPLVFGVTALPEYKSTVFAGGVVDEDDVIEDYDTWFIIPVFWLASPGITEITWDAGVYLLPINLAPGTYVAPLTVDLTVN